MRRLRRVIFGQVRRLRGVVLAVEEKKGPFCLSEEIDGGNFGQVRGLRGDRVADRENKIVRGCVRRK